MEQFETRKGSRVVISNCQNSAGVWQSRLYVNNGETATLTCARHKTESGARRWARKHLGGN